MSARNFVFPKPGDDFTSIAAREMAGVEDADQQLLSWTLHLAARAGLGRSVGLLPSDVVFTEPPRASTANSTVQGSSGTAVLETSTSEAAK